MRSFPPGASKTGFYSQVEFPKIRTVGAGQTQAGETILRPRSTPNTRKLNKAYGLPVIQWRDGIGVVEVPAEQFEAFARRILEVDGDPLPEEEEQALLAHVKV